MGRVVLGATGEGSDWRVLRDELVGRGWQVDLFDPSPREDDAGPEAELPLLGGVDLAILLATSPLGEEGTAANRRLVYLAGHLEQALEQPERVLFLREEGLPSLAEGTNVEEFEFAPGRIELLMPRITGRLAQNSVPTPPPPMFAPWLERFGVVDRRLPPEALIVLGLLMMLAAPIIGLVLYQWLYPSSPGPLATEVAGPAADEPAIGSAEVADGAEVRSPVDTIAPTPEGVVRTEGADGGSVTGLPARCVIDTRKGVVIPAVIACQGRGQLRIDGYRGPWHNQFGTLEADLGVIVEVYMETGRNIDGITVPPAVVNDLEAFGATGGVQEIILVFTADGQQVAIGQRNGRGQNRATFVFALESG
ncbi:MAG: hypothetical protein AAGD35_05645 [Actinomycetota bacterium]